MKPVKMRRKRKIPLCPGDDRAQREIHAKHMRYIGSFAKFDLYHNTDTEATDNSSTVIVVLNGDWDLAYAYMPMTKNSKVVDGWWYDLSPVQHHRGWTEAKEYAEAFHNLHQ